MIDLALLRDSGRFRLEPGAPTRLALVHHSFRTVSVRRGIARQRFAAHFPALGLLSLAHSLRTDASSAVLGLPRIRYFDQESYPDEEAMATAVTAWLGEGDRRIVAASSYTQTVDRLEGFMARFDPAEHLLVVGGSHATLAPDIQNVHLVVRGEGGQAIRHILTRFLTAGFGEEPESAGICYRLDGREIIRKPVYDRSIERLPPPGFAYDLLPDGQQDVYATNFTRMLGVRPQVYICTQSCQARCTFCSTYLIHGHQVTRPPELIAADLDYLVGQLGHDSLELHDDDLMQHPQLEAVLEVLAGTRVPWFCYARVEKMGADVAGKLAASGCRRIFLGIESMQQAKLDYFHKRTTVEQNRCAVESLAAAGIGVVAGFIIGAPDDTAESVLADLDAFLQLPLFAINCSILSPDPGTVEFRRARQREELRPALGDRGSTRLMPDPEHYGLEAPMGLPVVSKHISKPELNLLQAIIEASFYGRPEIWEGLVRGRTPRQRSLVSDYYAFVRHQLLDARGRATSTPVSDRLDSALAAVAAGPWPGGVIRTA
jgi:radical SAM superfamily enzyme YgiQ (UPF0313 family)